MTKNSMPLKVRARAIAILGQAINTLPPDQDGKARHEFRPDWSDQRVADETARAMLLPPEGQLACSRRHIRYMREELYGTLVKPATEDLAALRREVEELKSFNRYFARQYNALMERLGEPPVELPPE